MGSAPSVTQNVLFDPADPVVLLDRLWELKTDQLVRYLTHRRVPKEVTAHIESEAMLDGALWVEIYGGQAEADSVVVANLVADVSPPGL